MRARSIGLVLLLVFLSLSQPVVATLAHAQPAAAVPAPKCKQQAGTRDCRDAVIGPWRYLVKDILNDLSFDNEAAAYAYYFDHYERASVFILVYRWNAAGPGRYATQYVHSIEASAWKVYQRCAYLPTEPACDNNPEYVGYQRVRDIGCPQGYGFESDTTVPYCYALPAAASSTAPVLAQGAKR